jgi:uncharacterized protein
MYLLNYVTLLFMDSFEREFVSVLNARLREPLDFIQVVIGPRQVGKTTALKQIVNSWSGPSLMVTADEIAGPNAAWIEGQWRRARQMGDHTLLVFDEIQKVNDWSRVIKVLFDQDRPYRRLKIVLLGSASLSIQQGLSESLAGRFELILAPHWNFVECKRAFAWDLETFIRYGGYPAAATLIYDFERWKSFIQNSIIEPVLSKDLILVTAIHKPALFRHCFELAMAYPSQEISLVKLLGQLQESGNVTTIKHYLSLFEGAFLLKSLQKYSGSISRSRLSSPKLIPLNNAFPTALYSQNKEDLSWQGRLLESVVGAHLLQLEGELFYWRDGHFEVDYIFKTQDALYAIEVKSKDLKAKHSGQLRFLKHYPNAIPIVIHPQNLESFLSVTTSELLKTFYTDF